MWAQVGARDYLPARPALEVKEYYRQAAQSPYGEKIQEIVDLYSAALANGVDLAPEVAAKKLP